MYVIGGTPGLINLLISGHEMVGGGYGVSASVLLHSVEDEFEYSVTEHGLPTLAYDGEAYIKRARRSKLLELYNTNVILQGNFPNVQHFAFLGGDDCVEVVTQGELRIVALTSKAERDDWVGGVGEQVRRMFLT